MDQERDREARAPVERDRGSEGQRCAERRARRESPFDLERARRVYIGAVGEDLTAREQEAVREVGLLVENAEGSWIEARVEREVERDAGGEAYGCARKPRAHAQPSVADGSGKASADAP